MDTVDTSLNTVFFFDKGHSICETQLGHCRSACP